MMVEARHARLGCGRRGLIVGFIGELAREIGLHLGPEHLRRAVKESVVDVLRRAYQLLRPSLSRDEKNTYYFVARIDHVPVHLLVMMRSVASAL